MFALREKQCLARCEKNIDLSQLTPNNENSQSIIIVLYNLYTYTKNVSAMFTSIVLKFDNEPKSFSFLIDNILTLCDI
jgi:hypothetical protein